MTAAYDPNNIFAKILRGDIPCNKIYEDDFSIAFHDIAPKAPVHVLVIPKAAYLSIADFTRDAPAEIITGFYKAVGNVIDQLDLEKSGFRTIANTGINGGQEVPHFHLHLLGGRTMGPMVSYSE